MLFQSAAYMLVDTNHNFETSEFAYDSYQVDILLFSATVVTILLLEYYYITSVYSVLALNKLFSISSLIPKRLETCFYS